MRFETKVIVSMACQSCIWDKKILDDLFAQYVRCNGDWLKTFISSFRHPHANCKFHESRSNRIKLMSSNIFEYLMKQFLKCHSAAFAFIHLLPLRQCDFAYKNHTISTRSSRSMCLKVIRPWFFGAHEPSPSCFLCGKSIIPEVNYDIYWFSSRNGSYGHFIHQIWTKIAGYSRMLSAFYLALPSKPPWRGVLMVLLWRKKTLWMVVSWDLMALRLVLSFSLRELLRLQGVTLLMEEIRFTN